MDQLKYFQKAKQLNEQHLTDLLKYQGWHRGSLNGLSLVSLHPDRPQLDIKNIEELKIHSTLNRPGRSTPEKQLQSWIIYNALINDGILPFDQNIKFITDEFAKQTGSIKLVMDLFGFNPSTNTFVMIELKSSRALTELTNQLNSAEQAIRNEIELYRTLLSIHGYEWNAPFRTETIAVWPSANKRFKKFSSDIREVCYANANGSYSFYELSHSKNST